MFTATTAIEKYTQLDEKEKSALVELERIMQSGTSTEEKNIALVLEKYLPSTIFKLSEKNSRFRSYCETSPHHQSAWATYLQAAHYPGENIPSTFHAQKCSIYNQYVGCFLFSEYRKRKNDNLKVARFLLDKACEHRILYALTERCELNLALIKNTKNNEVQKSLALNQIGDDAAMLATQYWSVGAAYACRVYLSLGSFYNASQEEGDGATAAACFKEGLEYFCMAEILKKQNTSSLIEKFLVSNKNFFTFVFGQPFKSLLDAKMNFILPFIDNNHELYHSTYKHTKESLDKTLGLMSKSKSPTSKRQAE